MAIKMYTIGKHIIVTDEKSKVVFSKDINRSSKEPITKVNINKINELSISNKVIKAK